jgi:nicotinamide phosphoribosyltransferase
MQYATKFLQTLMTTTDSYKITQPNMRNGIIKICSYYEARKGSKFPTTKLFGLQELIIKFLMGPVPTLKEIDDAEKFFKIHFGADNVFDRKMWVKINQLGYFPLEIKAVPEGMSVPIDNVMFTITNTDNECADLVQHIETMLFWIWKPSLSMTKSAMTREIIREFLNESCDDVESALAFIYHDFGMRGATNYDQSASYGASHLATGALGTDTLSAIPYLMEYYDAKMEEAGFSVMASEHSVATYKGRDGESDVVSDILDAYTSGIVSLVADSYDIVNFIENIICKQFKDRILKREGKVVVRPDSPRFEGDTPEDQVLWIVETLADAFGYTTNDKGYKVLNPKIGCIYGDGLSMDNIEDIYGELVANGWSAENCVVGQGGYLACGADDCRDTQRSAIKCSAVQMEGEDFYRDVFKQPKDASKASKKGQLKLVWGDDGVMTTVSIDDERDDIMVTVFKDGKMPNKWTLAQVRENSNKYN